MKFSKGHACPTCGRSGGEKGNLTSTLDIFTQSAYLTEDAYCFINPYWHRKLIPDPRGFLDLQRLLHKKQAPDQDGELVLREKLEDDEEDKEKKEELKKELKDLSQKLSKELNQEKKKLDEEAKAIEELEKKSKEEEEKLKKEIEELKNQLSKLEEELAKAREEYDQKTSKKDLTWLFEVGTKKIKEFERKGIETREKIEKHEEKLGEVAKKKSEWNKKLEELRKQVSKKFLEVAEKEDKLKGLEKETEIVLNLHKFKCLWIFTNRLLCWLPYEGRDWFKEATFFVRSHSEDLPYFGWLKSAIEYRYKRAGYRYEENAKEWKKITGTADNPPPPPPENPSEFELGFLKLVDKQVRFYLAEYTYKPENLRRIYNENALKALKIMVDKFSQNSNIWPDVKFIIPEYKDMKRVAWNELDKLVSHIERKIDNTRKDYKLYLPTHLEKINDHRMLVTLKRDFTSEWYQRAFELEMMWHFQKRPLTKKQLEEWNTSYWTRKDGTVFEKKEPLKSHIFCPNEMNVGKSDDRAFDHFRLIINSQGGDEETAKYRQILIQNMDINDIDEFIYVGEDVLRSENIEELQKAPSNFLEASITSMRDLLKNPALESYKDKINRLEKIISAFGREMARRKGEQKEYEECEKLMGGCYKFIGEHEEKIAVHRAEIAKMNRHRLSWISNEEKIEKIKKLEEEIGDFEYKIRQWRNRIVMYKDKIRALEKR
jgi:hypothetical protein